MQIIGYAGLRRNAGKRATLENPNGEDFSGTLTYDGVDFYVAARKLPHDSIIEIFHSSGVAIKYSVKLSL